MRLILIVFLFGISAPSCFALDKVDQALYDYAKACPKTSAQTIPSLVDYLIKGAKTPAKQVEVFCYWIAENIAYDTQGYTSGNYLTTDKAFNAKRGICQNYTELLQRMCKLAGIECYVVDGYSKGYGYSKTKVFKATDHAWNVVKVDNSYHFIDLTWASGSVGVTNGKLTFKKKLDVADIFADPNTFLTTHLPGDPRWQVRDNPITLKSFSTNDSVSAMLKSTIPNYRFQDSITAYVKADSVDRMVMTAKSKYAFNPISNYISLLGDAYYTKAWVNSKKATTIVDYEACINTYNLAIAEYTRLNSTYGKQWVVNSKEGIKYCNYYVEQLKRSQ